ncbi:hypothetical protein [Fluviispira multicolorata]|uniref:Uncharacterized protein n=1 Tax=Fluviispira multicolorata TaxID=2654512 RepID=A0A833N692_9BACT|nr:hypothetical protein [Fluviispira multicolorata]KAB8029778.1 hypothetical protein GCL57_09555 [Fluviispira multicolorata]
MPKLFCEFLLDKKLIEPEQLLEAFIEHLSHIPSTAEIIYSLNMLSKNDLLEILIHQQKEGMDFRSSAKSLGFWTYNFSQEVSKKIQSTHKPFGEILIQKGYFNLDSLSTAFAHYTDIINTLKGSSIKEIKIPEAHNPTLSNEYTACFNNNILPNIQKIIIALKDENISAENIKIETRKALAEFVAVRAAANFLGAEYSQKVANEVVKYFQKIIDNNGPIELQKIIEIIDLAAQVLIHYCNCLKNFNNEINLDENQKILINKFNETFRIKG